MRAESQVTTGNHYVGLYPIESAIRRTIVRAA